MVLSKDEFIFLITVFVLSALTLILFFIVVLYVNVKIRKQKEIEKLEAVLRTQESERQRISEDLHDDIGPMLSAIKLQVNSINHISADEVASTVNDTTLNLDRVIGEVRRIVRNISPFNIESDGLVATIENFRSTIQKSNKICFVFEHEGMATRFTPVVELNIYRIVHELINNSLKHSNCTEITVVLKRYSKKSVLMYIDNGNVNISKLSADGMGMKNINNRVSLLNGKMSGKKDFSNGAFYYIVFDNQLIKDAFTSERKN